MTTYPMSWDDFYTDDFPRRESVADLKRRAGKIAKQLAADGQELQPAVAKGKKIANSFWGQAWNRNLERYEVYENRLPRGRSYLKNGTVIDLKITRGLVTALVSGTSLYEVTIRIKPLDEDRWDVLKRECAGKIESVIGLLQGKLPSSVMEAVIRPEEGLFPEPSDIRFDCTCPDDADLCKHTAAAAYGVGARLDESPELLFLLRGVDHTELIDSASDAAVAQSGSPSSGTELNNLGEIFGIDLGE